MADDDLYFSTTCNNFISNTISFTFCQPLYISYFFFFFLRFSCSPLFLTATLLVLLSVLASGLPHSKLGFVDEIQSKLNHVDREEDEIIQFEDFQIYQIVFRDPPLIMEEDTAVVAFEESTAEIEMKQDIEHVKMTSAVYGMFSVESDSSAEIETKRDLEHVKVTSAFSTSEIEMKSDLENVSVELQISETGMMTSLMSGDDQLTGNSSFTEKSNSSRFDSSSTFGSYESVEEDSTAVIEIKTTSNRKEFEEDLHKPVTSSFPGEDQLLSLRLNDSPVKVVEELQKLKPVTSSNSVIDNKTVNNLLQVDSSSSFGSYGSMRKEREWKRTLACKLFEERRSLEGGEEGMDSLWESYETDNSSRKKQLKPTNKNKINKKSEFKYFDDDENEEEEDDDEKEDEFTSNGQLCCLKALKLSTTKMNLGMGKPNLVKISKTLKGFGWLHHVGSKYGKKK